MTVIEKSGTETNFGRYFSNSKCVFMRCDPLDTFFAKSLTQRQCTIRPMIRNH